MKDSEIDYSDISPLEKDFFKNGSPLAWNKETDHASTRS